jgi:AcrR family transcriptional regulator|tara:strand:- start:5441 stop:6157 length:717 start_codon:yes stop_codon:yes gene_type:complete
MATWPQEISIEAFRKRWILEGEVFWQSVFEIHKDKMQIKNRKIAVVNLEKIFTATFKLANNKGFQSMSLRDLSKETGISMGGLYSYIGSKEDLASVIEEVQRSYIDQVIGDLADENLPVIEYLQAMIYGGVYMMEILSPWYYFCFMELKGLPKVQQQFALDVELRCESVLIDSFMTGVEEGQFRCKNPELLASQITAQMQQWHLKYWKFRLHGVPTQEYAQFIFDNLMLCLGAPAERH